MLSERCGHRWRNCLYWLIWIVLMLAIPLAAGVWALASLRAAPTLAAEERESALAADEA